MRSALTSSRRLFVMSTVALLLAGGVQAFHTGVGGDANGDGDVAIAGCTCHSEEPDNSVTLILAEVPHRYQPGVTYDMKIQIVGGPDIDSSSGTGGFSMKISAGTS